jgi:hypothetical protein
MRWMLLGIASWTLALILKNALVYVFESVGEGHWPNGSRGMLEGTISAACELGAAAVFLRKPSVRLIDAIAFGVAIGSFEVVFTLGAGFLEKLDDNLRFAGSPFDFVDGMFLFERFFAVIGHTAERVLIFVALCCKQWLPAGIAFVTFSFVDGLAAHGLAANWNWENAMVNFRFQMTVAAVTLTEGTAAAWFVRKHYPKLARANSSESGKREPKDAPATAGN